MVRLQNSLRELFPRVAFKIHRSALRSFDRVLTDVVVDNGLSPRKGYGVT